ncbi:hypothetical protein CDD80_2873 [Ophiocordyceps camponoti-rufipedis]|uniref:TPX2 C-terminal domain-containing protein n=1 Tax=Ophiocordyceps camponoti-rufipedis TaxID=2004952 RepID=A0A2C5Z4N0_9HYPO|nr:hypothetical protein CDD80_2873 [Ophiocordyceps camponoti-rufipedis]
MGPPLITGGSFDILQDEACPRRQFPPSAHAVDPRDALKELPVPQGHNQTPPPVPEPAPISKLAQHRLPRRPPRHRRPPVEFETFEPLDAVIEEPSNISQDSLPHPSVKSSHGSHPLTSLDHDFDVSDQVVKHLDGQFKWLMVYPAPTGNDPSPGQASSGQSVVYGCNFVRRNMVQQGDAQQNGSYAFVATPFKEVELAPADAAHGSCESVVSSARPHQHPGRPLKALELARLVERALSPSASVLSDGASYAHSSARSGPPSHSRIEDSLEEMDRLQDKLEDELEAVNAATLPRIMISPTEKGFVPSPTTPCTRRTSCTISKDAAVSSLQQASTVRIKPSEKTRPKTRRAASLTMRTSKVADVEAKGTPSSRDKPKAAPTTPNAATKSTKPLTIPKFELPGDAVARRLREQRLARQAQQAEAQQKAQTCSPKPRMRRTLTKPSFELPGEAISRRKREEREAKLRAEEEEDRKKREFKARPMRVINGSATLPRATTTSRARQARPALARMTSKE